ncbi:hypothetical protein ABPG74_003783 [Tetrahymena malaccensis]
MAENFELAAEEIANFFKNKGDTSDDNKLELYALYKQGTTGDNTTPKPGMLDFKGKAKWEAWNKKKGVAQNEAKAQYVVLANKVLATVGKKV